MKHAQPVSRNRAPEIRVPEIPENVSPDVTRRPDLALVGFMVREIMLLSRPAGRSRLAFPTTCMWASPNHLPNVA